MERIISKVFSAPPLFEYGFAPATRHWSSTLKVAIIIEGSEDLANPSGVPRHSRRTKDHPMQIPLTTAAVRGTSYNLQHCCRIVLWGEAVHKHRSGSQSIGRDFLLRTHDAFGIEVPVFILTTDHSYDQQVQALAAQKNDEAARWGELRLPLLARNLCIEGGASRMINNKKTKKIWTGRAQMIPQSRMLWPDKKKKCV